MNWEPQDKPGYSLLHAQIGDRLYAIQKKDGIGVWRLFVRVNDNDRLRTIFVGTGQAECMGYADIYEMGFTDGQ